MATTIRLTRMGRKKRPFYRMVVLDSRKRRDGAYLANLGYYNPFNEPHEVELHADDIINWLGKGATMSDTARSLLRSEGVLYQWSLVKAGLGDDDIAAKMTEWRQASDLRKANMVEAATAKKAAAAKDLADKAKAEAEEEAKAKAEEEAKAKAEAAAKAKEEADAKAKEEAEAKAAEEAAAAEAAAAEAPEAPEAEEVAAAPEETPAAEGDGEAPAAADEEPKKDSDGEGES